MSNHGYCKNCWWWNRTGKTTGHCIMQSYSPDAMHVAAMDSYIGVEGLQEDTYIGKSGNPYTFTVRKFIGENM